MNLKKAQERQKRLYDQRARSRSLAVGEQALVLLPNPHNSLKLEWVGPYKVLRAVTPVDYEVEMPGRRKEKRVYHINLLKRWYPPAPTMLAISSLEEDEGVPAWVEEGEVLNQLYPMGDQPVVDIQSCGAELPAEQRRDLHQVMMENSSVFHSSPGRTSLVEHEIHTGDALPIHQRPYRVPYAKRELVEKELKGMLEAKVIRRSTSPWVSPIVLVPKKDGVDYHKLNAKASFDAYPMPRVEEMFESIGAAKVISTLDFAKGIGRSQ